MNLYQKLGLKSVINASGKMTALGVSTISLEVAKAMKLASMSFVDMEALMDKAGEVISKYCNSDARCVTSCAAAGIAISIAACIAKNNRTLIEKLPNSDGLRNQVVIPKGHSINFGAPIEQMIRIGGGVPIEVGQANKVEAAHIMEAISKETAALFYVKSHHTVQKGMVSFQDMVKISQEKKIPLIVDAAAEEDLKKYVAAGADLVIYSGAKAIEGPTSGLITGKTQWISYCKLQYKGIGRAMKVGKENIMGLLKALEVYSREEDREQSSVLKKKMEWLRSEVNQIKGLTAQLIQDEADREIYRVQIKVDENKLGMDADYIVKELEAGDPSIYTRNYYVNVGIISVDPRPLKEGEERIILLRLKEIINSSI